MTQIKPALLAALLLATAACAGSHDAQKGQNRAVAEGAASATVLVVDLPDGDSSDVLTTPFEELADSESGFAVDLDAELVEDYGDICECTTYECQEAWVTATFGCDVCVVVDCGGPVRRGGCVLCD